MAIVTQPGTKKLPPIVGTDDVDELHGTNYILDFSQAEGDKIDLSFIESGISAAQTLSFIGASSFTGAAWQLRFEQVGGETIVSGDVDGDGAADFGIVCIGTINFTVSDFLL